MATELEQVRLLISDTDPDNQVFGDPEINTFLELGTNIFDSAALALETIAGNELQVMRRIKIMDLTTDAPAVAKELRELAKSLRTQSAVLVEAEDVGFEVAEVIIDDFQLREKLFNEWMVEYASSVE